MYFYTEKMAPTWLSAPALLYEGLGFEPWLERFRSLWQKVPFMLFVDKPPLDKH